MTTLCREMRYKGVPISRGIAIGKACFLSVQEQEVQEISIPKVLVEKEVDRYCHAILRCKEDLSQLQEKLKKEKIGEGVAILETYLQMVQDPLLTKDIVKEIRKSRKNAEFVFKQFITRCQEKFQSFENLFFRERFNDIQDISNRVLGYLRKTGQSVLSSIPAGSVVFCRELSASQIAEAKKKEIQGFITRFGSTLSHASIVAKAKGIPFVTDVDFDLSTLSEQKECMVIVDGRAGDVILNPTLETLQEYQTMQIRLNTKWQELGQSKLLPCETVDGIEYRLSANIDMVDEVDHFHKVGGHGVGLFRSEYIFHAGNGFPNEEDQFLLYRKLVKKMKGRPIVIRTFDFGGDKLLVKEQALEGRNPFLGCRAIRYLLKEKDIFKEQIRAILRSSCFGEVSMMFPMISSLQELMEAKGIVNEAREELLKRGEPCSEQVRIGSMIEVPSAVIIADLLAKECDFLSIGTNDLVQYSLAVDRRNHSTNEIFAPTDPSVLRMIKSVVCEANHQGIPVTVCGEIASDPRFTPLLLGLGVHELSVATRYIPVIKRAIRNTSIVDAHFFAEQVLSLTCSKEILDLLTQEYQKSIPDDVF